MLGGTRASGKLANQVFIDNNQCIDIRRKRCKPPGDFLDDGAKLGGQFQVASAQFGGAIFGSHTAKSPHQRRLGLCRAAETIGLLAGGRQIRTTTVRHLSRHTNAFTKRWMRMNRFADIHRVGTHFDGQGDFANHVAGMRANHAAT